jgi:HEAT repeat protein/energy-coupling factor transporter ATP-binding protein EcfA2
MGNMDETGAPSKPPALIRFLKWAAFLGANAIGTLIVKEVVTASGILGAFTTTAGSWLSENLILAAWLLALTVSLAATALIFWFLGRHSTRSLTGSYRQAMPESSELSEREAALRARYLKDVTKDVTGRMRRSLHHAHFIDLGFEQDAAALRPPWFYQDPDDLTNYKSIMDAFEKGEQRLLLLGHPGAGKTTALLHIASALIEAAAASAKAPVPILLNLSNFRLPAQSGRGVNARLTGMTSGDSSPDEHRRAFEKWLIQEIMNRVSGLDRAAAQRWLHDGRVAVLLDGLDEFNDARRVELATTLNEGFLSNHPTIPVVICTRINEYAVLRSKAEWRLKLRAAVQLQPLSDEQIADYLRVAKADGLLGALAGDSALQELARTPLTLSVLVLAYGGKAPDRPDGPISLSETRFHLFESYVERMLQRQARRASGKTFGVPDDNEIPVAEYRYAPALINRWLGWMALTLSVRMRTAFPPSGLMQLLMVSNDPRRQPLTFLAVHLVLGALIAVALVIIGLPIVPQTQAGITFFAATIMVAWLLFPAAGTARHGWVLSEAILGIAIAAALLTGVAFAARFLGGIVPADLSPYALVPLIMALATIIGMAVLDEADGPEFWWLVAGTASAIGMIVLLYAWPAFAAIIPMPRPVASLIAAWLFLGCGLALALSVDLKDPGTYLAGGLLIAVGALGCLATWLVPEIRWPLLLVSLAVAAIAIVVLGGRVGLMSIAAFTPFIVAGGVVGGTPGAFVGTIGAVTLVFMIERVLLSWPVRRNLYFDHSPEPYHIHSHHSLATLADRCFALLDHWLLSRLAWLVLALLARLPRQRRPFFDSTIDAFLLKPSQSEIEFVHRLLRDYFALRELMPRLKSDHGARCETIRALGYQGEAALDMLVEFVEQGEAAERAAATSALAHIPSPVSTQRFKLSLSDPSPEVRATLIRSISTLPVDDRMDLIREMKPLGDILEIEAILEVFPKGGPELTIEDDEASTSVRSAHTGDGGYKRLSTGINLGGHLIDQMEDGAIEQLLLILNQTRKTPQTIAILYYLQRNGDARALPAFVKLVRNRTLEIRIAVANGLKNFPDRDAERALLTLQNDRNRNVRSAARNSLAVYSAKARVRAGQRAAAAD